MAAFKIPQVIRSSGLSNALKRNFSSSNGLLASGVSRRWVLKNHFEGEPKMSDFEVKTEDLPDLKAGDVKTKALFWSVDPYMRVYPKLFGFVPPMTMIGSQVSEVVESKNEEFKVGDKMVVCNGWRDAHVFNPADRLDTYGKTDPWTAFPLPMKAIDLPESLSASKLLGAVGMPGNTAYFGLLDVCQPTESDTVVVSGAAGAVGSLVGQIAKIKGCKKVIGIAGGEEKCSWLTDKLGFDGAIDYKKSKNIRTSLKRLAPEGVDVYFDNVGGQMSYSVMTMMNQRGRIGVCGAISGYNDTSQNQSLVPAVQPIFVANQLKMEGLIVWRWQNQWNEGLEQLRDWVADGKLVAEETVVEGFDNLPSAFMSMLQGGNLGKMIVKSTS